jgi:7-keto-8-aminopelargonate synthetase-like enzyme
MQDIFEIDHLPNRTVTHQGQEYLFFSGTAYLGLPQHSDFQNLMVQAINQFGTVFGSSRNGNVRLGIYEKAEAKLTAWITGELSDTTSALTISSGMMAGQAVVNWLRGQGNTFIYAPKTHPALWLDPVVSLPALSFTDWVAQLPIQVRATEPGPIAILVNSIDAVSSVYYHFDWMNDLPTDRPITIVVDDSHGLGVLNNGQGIWPQISHKPTISLLVTASLAKAMGMPGGVIVGDTETIQALRSTAFFGACSPMPPANLAVYLQADTLYTTAYERLYYNVQLAEELLLPTGLFQHATGYPVFFTERDDLYPFLLQNGVLIYSFAYPTVHDRANTRIVISAFHKSEDIQKLAELVNEFNG